MKGESMQNLGRSIFVVDRRAELRNRLRQKQRKVHHGSMWIPFPDPLPEREVVTRLIARVRTL